MGLVASSHASSGVHPRLTNLVCTSAKLTVLATATASSSGVSLSYPGSRLMSARIADASSTTLFLFMSGCYATLGQQFVNQRRAGFHIMPGALLRPLDAALLSRDAQFVVLDPQHNLISYLNAKGFTEGCRDNNAAILIHACTGFDIHVMSLET